jgi:hypothetical protein
MCPTFLKGGKGGLPKNESRHNLRKFDPPTSPFRKKGLKNRIFILNTNSGGMHDEKSK